MLGSLWLKRLAALALGLVLTAVTLEVVLRFLPVCDVAGDSVVDAEHPVLTLRPKSRTIRSEGPGFDLVAEVVANNVGFRNDRDYVLDESGPLVALVGDSYVIAATVEYEATLAARLDDVASGAGGRVYSFGIRGAAFPQYLVWAQYARENFRPDAFVFVIVGNDFRGSLLPAPGYHYFRRGEGEACELVRVDSRSDRRRPLLQYSALARYLMLNCQLHRGLVYLEPDDPEEVWKYVGNIAAQASEEDMRDYAWAFDAFLDRIPEATGVGYDRVVFLVDGMRPHMYVPEELAHAEASAWGQLRRMVLERAPARGIETIDLHPRFVETFEREGRPFETEDNDHWNAAGHAVAAEAAANSGVFQSALRSDG